jgi:ribosomal protein L35
MIKHSIRDRIKITKSGKLIRRKMGLDHFRAKKSGTQINRKDNPAYFAKSDRRVFMKKYGL